MNNTDVGGSPQCLQAIVRVQGFPILPLVSGLVRGVSVREGGGGGGEAGLKVHHGLSVEVAGVRLCVCRVGSPVP